MLLTLICVPSFSFGSKEINGVLFKTRSEYKMRRPCACPNDFAANGRCGRRAALCKRGGEMILDCDSTMIHSMSDYRRVQIKHCGYAAD